ncbi:MAG: RNA 2',3'-cyclic phosphodiesterase [Treponema sp.]|nr:RNA 2',3'-cyclic phosphodiesterase [Treponema sp.]
MMRLFIAINCNEETRNLLLSVQEKIKAQSTKGSFSRPENLHLTLTFLGETPATHISRITSIMEEALQPPVAPFTLTFSQTGCFRHSGKELWWVGVDPVDPSLNTLKELKQRLANGLSARNIAFDKKPFKPHVTLGREIKHDAPIVIPKQEIFFPVNRISLMQSERLNGVLVYTEIVGRDLKKCRD